MQYNWNGWRLYNNLTYAPEFNQIRESSSSVALYKTDYSFRLGHTYKQLLPDDSTTLTGNDIYLNFGYVYSKEISLNGGLAYNIDKSLSQQWRFGGSYKRDCWSVATSLRRDITPRPTGFTTDTTFFVQFNFIPFGSIGTGDQQ
jgi:LPS-assembly protein